MCRLRTELRLKRRLQCGQPKGRDPECVFMCTVRCDDCEKRFLHTVH